MKNTEIKGLTLEQAYKIMGERIVDVNGVDRMLNLIPYLRPIPFTEWELDIHANEGHRLYFKIPHTNDGQPLNIEMLAKIACKKGNRIGQDECLFWSNQFNNDGTVKPEAWFYNDPLVMNAIPGFGWEIASEEVISDTLNLDYINQTDVLIGYNKRIYKNHLPEHYKEAIAQWEGKRLIMKDMLRNRLSKSLYQELHECKITSLIRESFVSTEYRRMLIYEAEKRKILQRHWNWSNTHLCIGKFVFVGLFDSVGANIGSGRPDYYRDSLGVSFSRSGNIED